MQEHMQSPIPDTPDQECECKTVSTPPTWSQTLLDFSFLNIDNITELEESQYIEPRPQGNNKKVPKKVIVEVKNEEDEVEQLEKYETFGIRLTSNALNDAGIEKMLTVFDRKILDPMALTWIDLSSNLLTKINGEIFCSLNLKILYLHDNSIADLKEVDKLTGMNRLTKLTLHCNPIANNNRATYRNYVLSRLPQLISFDFSTVIKGERKNAEIWHKGVVARTKQTQQIEAE